jgi:hypothetical protein
MPSVTRLKIILLVGVKLKQVAEGVSIKGTPKKLVYCNIILPERHFLFPDGLGTFSTQTGRGIGFLYVKVIANVNSELKIFINKHSKQMF